MDVFIKETGKMETLDLHNPENGKKYYNGFVEARMGLVDKVPAKVEVWIASKSDYALWQDLIQKEQVIMNLTHSNFNRFTDSVKLELANARNKPFVESIERSQAILSRFLDNHSNRARQNNRKLAVN